MKLKLSIAAATVIVVIGMLYRFNPVEYQLLPRCLFKQITSLSCPGCGMQRFVHALTNGHVGEAIGYNAFMLLFIPYVLCFATERLLPPTAVTLRLRRIVESRTATALLAAGIVVWFVVRNIMGV